MPIKTRSQGVVKEREKKKKKESLFEKDDQGNEYVPKTSACGEGCWRAGGEVLMR